MRQMSRQAHNPFHESNSPQDEPCSPCASLMGSADVLARDFGRHRWAQQWFDRKEIRFKNKGLVPGSTFKAFSFGVSHLSKYMCGVTLYGVQTSEAEAYRTMLSWAILVGESISSSVLAVSTWYCW
ncbi:hypothetical protein BDV35DRAFT_350211 [Aspergillus flavus]|uniref:Uncharacterized protein n=1 Tax=Aspergillus flavus TaxID=5059 RepID=A0A5N6H5B3_ASPFL|nr:hypothetical protein BDV35DRAFT_350211 [Aspergillus flavus]